MTSSRKKKNRRRFISFFCSIGAIIVILLAIALYLFFQKAQASIYVFPENLKQGDTIFIRVKTSANKVAGNFNGQKLDFYKKSAPIQAGNLQEWISFLGIDADQKPDNYKIYVDTSNAEHLAEEVKVSLASFSTQSTVKISSYNQNEISNQKAVDNIRNSDNPELNKILKNSVPAPYFTLPFYFPLGKTEEVGFSFGKFIKIGKYALQHFGVDLRAPKDTEIYAVNNGKVVGILNLSNYGKTVVIDHGLNIFSLYLHLDKFEVSSGEIVRRGQLIGLSGDTGYVTAPHLHFSIRVGGSRVDPIAFIQTSQKLNSNFFIADISVAYLNLFNKK